MKKETIASLAILGTVLIASPAVMAERGGEKGKPPSFEEIDINGDGVISKDEAKGPLERDFDKLDANGDGVLSMDELPEPPEGKRAPRE